MVVSWMIHSVMLFPVMELTLEGASSGRSMGQQLAFIRIMEWGFLILPESGIIGRRIIIVYSFPLAHWRGCFKGIMYSFGSSLMI